mgnify:CR=1 FL=1
MKVIKKIMGFGEIFKNDNSYNEKTIIGFIICCYGVGYVG